MKIKDWLIKYVNKELTKEDKNSMIYPPPVAKTLGFDLVEVDDAYAVIEMDIDPEKFDKVRKQHRL